MHESTVIDRWPLRKIIWGIYWTCMNGFVNARSGIKDEFDTQVEASQYIKDTFSPKEIRKNGIYVMPKKRISASSILAEDV